MRGVEQAPGPLGSPFDETRSPVAEDFVCCVLGLSDQERGSPRVPGSECPPPSPCRPRAGPGQAGVARRPTSRGPNRAPRILRPNVPARCCRPAERYVGRATHPLRCRQLLLSRAALPSLRAPASSLRDGRSLPGYGAKEFLIAPLEEDMCAGKGLSAGGVVVQHDDLP